MAAVTTRVDVKDVDRKIVKPFQNTARHIEQAQKRAISDALKSVQGRSKKLSAQEYDIKPHSTKKLLRFRTLFPSNAKGAAEGVLRVEGGVGTELRRFPGQPSKAPAEWFRREYTTKAGKLKVRKAVRWVDREPKQGVASRVFKGGPFKVYRPPAPYQNRKTFWIRLKAHRKSDRSDVWLLAYRRHKGKGGLSSKGLFAASLIQAVGRKDILNQLRAYARERYGIRLAHYLDAYLKGILK